MQLTALVNMNAKIKKEWIGEHGYCNCLLVTMSRVPVSKVELFSDRELPALASLSVSRPDTVAWLRAQELDSSNLDPSTVISILLESANMGRWPWSKNTGTINVVDCVGDDGPTVDRVFILRRSKMNGTIRLQVNLNSS